MDTTLCYKIIKDTALENNLKIEGAESSFVIESGKVHAESFKIVKKDSFLVYQWENKNNDFGKDSIYSLRNTTDVIKFCNILIASLDIRAGRDK